MGKLDLKMLQASLEFTERQISPVVIRGYLFWAVPYVRLMRRKDWLGKLATAVVLPFARCRSEEIMFRLGRREKGSLKGKLIRWIGEPACYAIGLFVSETDYRVLYNEGQHHAT